MKEIPRPENIPAEDWAATPVSVKTLVLELLKVLGALSKKPSITSRNSSQPPSKDQKSDLSPKKHSRKRGPPQSPTTIGG